MLAAVLAVSALAAAASAAPPGAGTKLTAEVAPPTEKIEFPPGREVRVKIPGTQTADEHFIVYAPADYTPEQPWPVIFWFHGLNGRPTVGAIKRITEGKRFILVGVSYHMRGMEGYDHYERDIENLKILVPYLERFLKLDRRLFFVGGFSKGAFFADRMLCASAETWAGALLLGGGKDLVNAKNHAALRGKPIFIGCGENDVHLKYAEKGQRYYTRYGAQVTAEVWPGLGHRCKTDSQALRKWLWDNGPLKRIQGQFQAARKSQRAGRLGEAYLAYQAIAAMSETDPTCAEAAKEAEALAEKATTQLAAAAQAGRGPRARRLLAHITVAYRGTPFGEQARAELDRLRAAGTTQPTTTSAPSAGDDDADKAARICRGYLSMSESLLRAGKPEKAKSYLRRIIEDYPNTEWARQAEARLEQLSEAR